MLLILTIIPLAIGLMIVIMALLKKLKPQPVEEEGAVAPEIRVPGNPSSSAVRDATGAYKENRKKEVFR
jgi:hypothetical protein